MAGISTAITLSKNVAVLCHRYAKSIDDANADLQNLQNEIILLDQALSTVKGILDGPGGHRLRASQPLAATLEDCKTALTDVGDKLKGNIESRKKNKWKTAKGAKIRLRWPFDKERVDRTVEELARFRYTISTTLNLDQTGLIIDGLEHLEKKELIEILEWISPVKYGAHHDSISSRRTPETCNWLLEHDRFKEWKSAKCSMILWLQGSPGAGKTYLTSKVIDFIRSETRSSAKEGLAYFYCNRDEDEWRDPLMILRSYVRQLSTAVGHTGVIRPKLRDKCRERRERGSDLRIPDCKDELLESINAFSGSTLILDALDECDPDSRGDLVDILGFLLCNSSKPLKVFISSRPDRDIRLRFSSRPNIAIQATDNGVDISSFIRQKIAKHGRHLETFSQKLKDDVEKVLLTRSQGMFQWAYLQIKHILQLETEEAVRDRLGKLPKALKESYDEIYGRIKSRHSSERNLADRAFMWLMVEPGLDEHLLLQLIRLPSTDSPLMSEKITESQLLHLCNNLVVNDSKLNRMRFSHLSVIEYFETQHWSRPDCYGHAVGVCLNFFKHFRKSSLDTERTWRRPHYWPWPRDAKRLLTNYWPKYLDMYEDLVGKDRVKPSAHVKNMLKAFLGSPTQECPHFRQRRTNPATDCVWNRQPPGSTRQTVIQFMCRTPVYNLLQDWWEHEDMSLWLMNGDGRDLLALAAGAGSLPICMKLVNMGKAQIHELGLALAIAIYAGHDRIACYLIEEGADMSLPAIFEGRRVPLIFADAGSLLCVALENDYRNTNMAQYLIWKGVDVNLDIEHHGSVLANIASWKRPWLGITAAGKMKKIRFLLQNGAEINRPLLTGIYGSALCAAVEGGDSSTIELLIDCGADVNQALISGRYGSALICAAYISNTRVAKLLIVRGADVNFTSNLGNYRSALVAAAASNKLRIVQLLVKQGADVSSEPFILDGRFDSNLCFPETGLMPYERPYVRLSIIRFLIEKGAPNIDVEMPMDHKFGNLLTCAAHYRDLDMIEFLIKRGADVNRQLTSGRFANALIAAIDQEDNRYVDIPLDAASATEVFRALTEQGAEYNHKITYGRFSSVMDAAVTCGSLDVVQRLLDLGVQINDYQSPHGTGNHLTAAIVHYHFLEIPELPPFSDYVPHRARQIKSWKRRMGRKKQRKSEAGKIIDLLMHRGADIDSLRGYINFEERQSYDNINDFESPESYEHFKKREPYGSALTAAIYLREIGIAKLLVHSGANVNLALRYGPDGTPLTAAAARGQTEMVAWLIHHGADVNSKCVSGYYGSALAAAIGEHWTGVVQLLLDKGADVNLDMTTETFKTPFETAIWRRSPEMVCLLLHAGAVAKFNLRRIIKTATNLCISQFLNVLRDADGLSSQPWREAEACRVIEITEMLLLEEGLASSHQAEELSVLVCQGFDESYVHSYEGYVSSDYDYEGDHSSSSSSFEDKWWSKSARYDIFSNMIELPPCCNDSNWAWGRRRLRPMRKPIDPNTVDDSDRENYTDTDSDSDEESDSHED